VARRFSAASSPDVAQRFSAASSPDVAQRFSAATALPAIWAIVAFALLARVAFGIAAVHRLARRARPADARWRQRLADTIDTLGIHGRVRLLVSRDIGMPMTWGSRVPVLLLPVSALEWSDERAGVVLLHELAHVRRGDWLTHALGRLLAALHWFNPLAWIALNAMARERERACDDFVLAHGARPSDYAQHLLDIARASLAAPSYAMAPAMARHSELEGRLLSILTPRGRVPARTAAVALSAAAIAVTAVVAAAAPRSAPEPAAPGRARPANPARVPLLADHAADTPAEKRRAATERAQLQPLARTALRDPDEDAREKATLALAMRSEPGVVDALLGALNDDSSQVREKAALGLALRRDPRVVDALLDAAADVDAQVREKVIIALSLSGDRRALDAITRALEDPDPQVREKATSGLTLFSMASLAGRGGAR
jgi:beta-lactamase regulating signal transducer with metallopeptidase domain